MKKIDICLISMPFNRIDTPPLGMGLLSAAAKQAGMSTRSIHATFRLAEITGVKTYKLLELLQTTPTFYGEWLFSEAAFPGTESDTDWFFRTKLHADKMLSVLLEQDWFKDAFVDPDHVFDLLVKVKEKIPAFVEEIVDLILAMEPEIVGCSSSFQQQLASIALLRRIREKQPRIATMLGGANCSGTMGVNIKRLFPFIDYVATGEADTSFPRLCSRILEKPDTRTDDLPIGIVSQSNLRQHMNTVDTSFLHTKTTDLDSLPYPDFDDYFAQLSIFKYRHALKNPTLILETSRGCWWGEKSPCSFCGLNSGGFAYRKKNPDRALLEIEHLSNKYRVNKIMMADNILAMDYLHSVMPALSDQFPARFVFFWEVKANLAASHVNGLKKAGVRIIQPGIEHLDNRCLKLMNKGTTTLVNLALLKYALENGIWVAWNMLLDSPGEEDVWYEDLCRWLPSVFHLQPPSGISPIRFDRFSRYGKDPGQYGLDLIPREEYSYLYPFSEEDCAGMAYFFEDRIEKPAYRGGPWKARLRDLVAQWHQSFNKDDAANGSTGLRVKQGQEESIITDSRPCSKLPRATTIKGAADLIYRRCHSPQSKTTLFKEVSKENPSIDRQGFDVIIEFFTENLLMLEIDHKLLSLALLDSGSFPSLMTDTMFRDQSAAELYSREKITADQVNIKQKVSA